MSEISKARERILNKQGSGKDASQKDSTSQKQKPRKFTLSSLTHQLEPKFESNQISPSQKMNRLSPVQFMQESGGFQSSRSFISRAKENVPMIKTINIKIKQINTLSTPASHFNYQQPINEDQGSVYMQSPPKVIYKKTLHRDKIDLIVAPPQARRHQSPYKPKECLLEWIDEYVAEQCAGNQSYTDQFFPPKITIIFNKKLLYQEEGLKFQRLSRIYHNDIAIVNNCEPTYLSMGKYSNPYLYSALCILAEDPSKIISLFGTQQANQQGIYYVNLCKDGVWRYIVIDDFVPVKSTFGKKQLLFLHGREIDGSIQIWSSLIQKAVAKIYGTYLDLAVVRDDGMSDILRILTGAPISAYSLTKQIKSYLIIIDTALKRKHIVTLQAIPQQHQETAKVKNLSIYQAYKVLEIKKSGLKIRNYAEPELVTKIAFEECTIFSRLIIYKIEPNYRYITQKLRHKKKYYSYLLIKVPVKTRGYFEVWQNNPAYYKKHLSSNIQYQLSKVKVWIAKQQEEGDYIQSGKDVQLFPGNYQMRVHLCQQKQYDFTLSYYGQKQISMQRIKNMDTWPEPCLCGDLYQQ